MLGSRGRSRPADLKALADEELMELVHDGEVRAFEVVFDRHATVAFSLAYRMCGRRAAAEDIVQEAFLSLWRSSRAYDPARGSVRSWVLTVVHNRAIDALRRQGPRDRRDVPDDGIAERLAAPDRTDAEAERRDEARRVRTALDELPPDQRRVIELAYFRGFTHSEIAKMLDLPPGTVKGRMRLGLDQDAKRPQRGVGVSGGGGLRNGRECGEDAAAYVLGSLEPAEAEAFRRHLAGCTACQQEVAELEQVTGSLADATVRYEVPRDLRRRVLSEVRATPKARASRPARVRRPVVVWGGALAAAVVIVAVVLVVALGSGGSSSRTIQASTGSAELKIADGRADLIVRSLPHLSAGRIYEMWVQRGNATPTPTGTLFAVTSNGTAAVGVPGGVSGVSAVMVTQEPAGGTPAPTTAPVIVARLT